MNSLIQVKAIVEWRKPESRKGEMARILYVDPGGEDIVLFPLPGDKDFPLVVPRVDLLDDLERGAAFIKPFDPYAPVKISGNKINEKHIKRRDKAWLAIEGIVQREPEIYDCEVRGRLVASAASSAGTIPKCIYKYLRSYWRGGKIKNSLMPDYGKCGGRSKEKSCNIGEKRGRPRIIQTNPEDVGVNITEMDKVFIRIATNEYYCKEDEHPVRKCYETMMGEYYGLGVKEDKDGKKSPVIPPVEKRMTIQQFRYWLHKFLDIKKALIARKGLRKFNLKHRQVLKDSTSDAFGPGHIYQIDATIADIYLLSSLDRKRIIGRPILYFVMDVFSRMIVGIYIGLSGPNYIGAAMALQNAASNKVEFCQRYGITIDHEEWPVAELSECLVADRAELLSNQSNILVDDFDMEILNTPSWRGDLKGIVEQQFNRANVEVIHWSPGAVLKDSSERGSKDPRLEAKLTLDEFTKQIIYMVLNHNQTHHFDNYHLLPEMLADGVNPIPLELWEWGIVNRMGCLRSHTKQELLRGLMPSGEGSVTHQGIRFKGMYYTCPVADEDAWFIRARASGNIKVKISFDPRNMDQIYVHPEHGGDLIPCDLLEKCIHLSGHRDEDIEMYWHLRKVQGRVKDTAGCQGRVSLEARLKEINDQASAETKAAWENSEEVSKNKRTGAIRENRKEELQVRNALESFRVEETPHSAPEPLAESTEDSEDDIDNDHDCMLSILLEN